MLLKLAPDRIRLSRSALRLGFILSLLSASLLSALTHGS